MLDKVQQLLAVGEAWKAVKDNLDVADKLEAEMYSIVDTMSHAEWEQYCSIVEKEWK